MIHYQQLKSTNGFHFNFVILAPNLFPFLYVWEALRDEKAIFEIRHSGFRYRFNSFMPIS